MSKRVYISGKIGEEVISKATRRKFAEAEEMLKARGYEVFNPTDERWQKVLKEGYDREFFDRERTIPANSVDFYAYVLLRDMMALATKDAIYLLPDWKKSPGATCEHAFAVATGKALLFADRFSACEYLVDRMYKEVRAGNPPGEYLELSRNDAEIAYFKKHLSEVYIPMD